MEDVHIEVEWLLGSIGGLILLCLSIWWKVESLQNKKIDDLSEQNHNAHQKLHHKIDTNDLRSEERHNMLRDKIDEIWRHIVTKDN